MDILLAAEAAPSVPPETTSDPLRMLLELLPEAWRPYVILFLIIAYVVTKWRSQAKTAELQKTIESLKVVVTSINQYHKDLKEVSECIHPETLPTNKRETAIRVRLGVKKQVALSSLEKPEVSRVIQTAIHDVEQESDTTVLRKKSFIQLFKALVDKVF